MRLINFASYHLDSAIIINDLSKERPQWILSAYGPGREAPLQLFGGLPREQSFEELRLRHYELSAQKRAHDAIQEAQTLVNNAEQQIQTALNNVEGAIKYIINGENEHPNRVDNVRAKGAAPAQTIALGQSLQSSSAFGQPSTTAPSFGQPSLPSAFAKPSAPTFGQPSAPTSTFGQGSLSSFGQPSALGSSTSAFGQPSLAFGKPLAPSTVFGQPSTQSPFGLQTGTVPPAQPSTNPFGQPSNTEQPGPFGQPSVSSQSNVFGKPPVLSSAGAFGQPTTVATTASTAPANPFYQPAASSSGGIFGQPPATTTNSFSQSSKTRISYANRPVPSFGFSLGSLNLSQNHSNSANRSSAQSSNPIITPRAATGLKAGSNPAAQGNDEAKKGKISSWKGKPVTYLKDEPCFKGNDGAWQRVWFPHGPPVFNKTPQLPEEAYSRSIEDEYKFLKENGAFKNGIMPEVPPKKEWCSWDF